MWICNDCMRRFNLVKIQKEVFCPFCGSVNVRVGLPEEGSLMDNILIDDQVIVRSLLRCGVDYSTIFNLVWGEKMIDNEEFPLELRTVVANIYYREKGKGECLDPIEKKLHGIIIDILYVLYEKQITDLVEQIKEQARLSK